ncbi:hypothetical protein EJ03DRAFT_348234 [Teratosphaeria nubilosa]|uniref:Gem-associated protein 5 TPR domain-containing protein n=1 Tax=Teratosphaeria nubilosa TaxID=161662 RepID=A0A6G1LII8_9PEZI|nr:hypothetical protein EJ03DRAFT_348234 [Teratosphaeria nubilosa]
MSSGQIARHSSRSEASKTSFTPHHAPPQPTLTPENTDDDFEPCAATASFFLYAQRNLILVLHHDTLAIERRFGLHREDVLWIYVDNSSDRGSGRSAVSYDAGHTAIVWDILSGSEIARFSSYERMRHASFMRNGNIAFGNDQGNIILFEPSTSEHISARTIFDPITAIAPSSDCRTFAIGYLNGSILVATLQPSFTILHTLTTTRAPSRITGLAWHGSSSKQRTDMLATQTSDGDMRVWSVPKAPHQESPNIIRVLQRAELQAAGLCWFAWSKTGRIVQHAEGETRSWDVRTKKVTYDVIPTIDGVTGIACYGPTATLFTLGRNHTVQQYDITPGNAPLQVQSVQHVPANTPPTPPTNLEESYERYGEPRTAITTEAPATLPFYSDQGSSADEGASMSPLQKLAREMDSLEALESEVRDKVGPLSPVSSRASSVSSQSSRGSRRARKYLYDKPESSRASTSTGMDGTEFSFGEPVRQGHESMSIRSVSSFASRTSRPRQQFRSSNLRQELPRSPEETKQTIEMDLFPNLRARVRDVPFRTPHYGNMARTPELLQREMLSVVFGWNDDIENLIRNELSSHRPGSAAGVLLSKWLGDMGADSMASMVGSESMTSSDWMMLALSSIGQDSQKKVGEAFVQRLLEKGDIHPAVAILLGLGEFNDAIEVYVSSAFWMEAVLLTCLTMPTDWGRQSFLIRKWGEASVQQGQAELAVRCFSCTSIETSEPWFSPRAQQDAAYAAQQQRLNAPLSAGPSSPPMSPPSASGSDRIKAKNASLKLITSFGAKGIPLSVNQIAATPIAESALSPGGLAWWRERPRDVREPSTARTATPGGYQRKERLPSKSDIERAKADAAEMSTPMTAARDFAPQSIMMTGHSRRASGSTADSLPEPSTAVKKSLAPTFTDEDRLPSPGPGVFEKLRAQSQQNREQSRDRKPPSLASLHVVESGYDVSMSSAPSTGREEQPSGKGNTSPPLIGAGAKARAIDEYISSVEQARATAREERAHSRAQSRTSSRKRNGSRADRGVSRARSDSLTKHVRLAKRSPSSPIPMSPEEIAQASQAKLAEPATTDDESFYKITSPAESHKSMGFKSELQRKRKSPKDLHLTVDARGRSASRGFEAALRSPSLPPLKSPGMFAGDDSDEGHIDHRLRLRARSSNRKPSDDLQSRRAVSRNTRARSASRRPKAREASDVSASSHVDENISESSITMASEAGPRRPRNQNRKELAAKELEERRLSLARRPSAPTIPLPGEVSLSVGFPRPRMSLRSHTELGDSPASFKPPMSRSQTVDPEVMNKYNKVKGPLLPPMGLPATPRAMRHPRYMSADPNERDAPPLPVNPGNLSELSSLGSGSSLSQITGSNLSQATGSNIGSNATSNVSAPTEEADDLGPLLPSTVFGQKAPPRSASAPPENMGGKVHPLYKAGLQPSSRKHVRKISPPEAHDLVSVPAVPISIDEALSTDQIIIIPEEDQSAAPALLPQLQHLAGPPPPPPPPTMFQQPGQSSDVINITIENNTIVEVPDTLPATTFPTILPATTFPHPMERATTASPSMHRRGSVSEAFGSKFRGVADRMRSQSRGGVASTNPLRTKSPPMPDHTVTTARPYETVLPPMPTTSAQGHRRRDSLQRAKSPYEQAMASGGQDQQIPPPPPPPPAPPAPGMEGRISETAVPPQNLPRSGSTQGYRNPKEIRANMPPETLQQGVFSSGGFL